MGQEIQKTCFSTDHFRKFSSALTVETQLLNEWLSKRKLEQQQMQCGFELEAWLINHEYQPAPANEHFLALANNPLMSAELAQFNIEINTSPQHLQTQCFSEVASELHNTWQQSCDIANNMGLHLGMFGILPTLALDNLNIDYISESNRYAALNEQILKQRQGRPLKIDISGEEHLHVEQMNVMLESATTSFQLHWQLPAKQAAHYYNASLLASSISVAIAANSPYLLGKQLWAETRIPLFEQAVEVGGYAGAAQGPLKRVSFGSCYLKASAIEAFEENLHHFPVLLATLFNSKAAELKHLRLHNGTIWRWNRPLVDFDANGHPHLRIEHRVMPAGPSIVDMLANAAFYYGFVHSCAQQPKHFAEQLSFATVRDNFYKAAQHGLDARIKWLDDKTWSIKKLILNQLLPIAKEGLQDLNINIADQDYYLNIIEERVSNQQNGSRWQIDFIKRTGHDMRLLTEMYLKHQQSNAPVHTWELPKPPQKTYDPKLSILHSIPAGLTDTAARDLHRVLDGPTLLCLPGHASEGIFISVLLHGNEDSGWLAIRRILKKYQDRLLPRPIYLFIGNIEAARYAQRRLEGQIDYNRAWPGTPLDNHAEVKLIQSVYDVLEQQSLWLSIDLHNNTGLNPHYACVNRLDNRYLYLALLFSRTVVYFTQPRGVQSLALSKLCPAVTVECGKIGDQRGIEKAQNFIDVCLNQKSISNDAIQAEDIDLFETVAQVKIPEKIRFSFDHEPADIYFSHELEYMNFREVTVGTPFGDCANLEQEPLIVLDHAGNNVFQQYFRIDNGILRLKCDVMPSMLTTDERVIRQDCFCYLMQRISPSKL